jgi:hypothetical protein
MALLISLIDDGQYFSPTSILIYLRNRLAKTVAAVSDNQSLNYTVKLPLGVRVCLGACSGSVSQLFLNEAH